MTEGPSTAVADKILEIAERLGALQFGEFRLTAGGASSYYFDGRLITLDPEGSYTVANALLPVLAECGADAVAGPAVAAVPMVSAVAAVSYAAGTPIKALIVRDEAKKHGTGKIIEGSPRNSDRVAVVDDTCMTGGSLLHTIDTVEKAGCTVVIVACILDRREGGSNAIRARGYDFFSFLEADNGRIVPAALGQGVGR